MKPMTWIALFCALWLGGTVPAGADGLSTRFAYVDMKTIETGRPYHVLDSDGHGLRVKNLGASPVKVSIQVLAPQPALIHGHAQAIPDTSWIEVNPQTLDLGPHEERESEVILHVPRKKDFRNKSYQAMIWTRGLPTSGGGTTISAGLLSRVRFRTQK